MCTVRVKVQMIENGSIGLQDGEVTGEVGNKMADGVMSLGIQDGVMSQSEPAFQNPRYRF